MAEACSRCGKTIYFISDPFCRHCGAPNTSTESATASIPPPSDSNRIAWETDALNNAPVPTLWATLIDAICHPDRFFKKTVLYESPPTAAWIFALTSGSIGLAASWLWSIFFIRYGASFDFLEPLFGSDATTPYMLLFTPLFLSFQLLCSAAYVKILFRFTRFKRAPFSPVFRVICYAEAPMVLQIIPFIGTFIATPLWVYAVLTGLHHLYGAGRFRVFIQLLLPIFVTSTLCAILLFAGILGGIMAGAGSMFDPWSIIDQFSK